MSTLANFVNVHPQAWTFEYNTGLTAIISPSATPAREEPYAGAALNVFQSEPISPDKWMHVTNTVLTPHVGGYTGGVQSDIQQLIRRNNRVWFDGRPIERIVVGKAE